MDKIKMIKEAIQKIKSGVQTIRQLPTKLKQAVQEFLMKKVGVALFKYVLIPIIIVAIIVALFYGIFGNIADVLKNAMGSFVKGINFFIKR